MGGWLSNLGEMTVALIGIVALGMEKNIQEIQEEGQ